ncbi:MAG TPA: LCP family protein [Acidimicrobiales bacterium]|nr:LCP family protein [Acidimicrobiales bacterium]
MALALLSSALVYGYVRYRESQLKTIVLPALVKPAAPAPAASDGLSAMNILLVGSNTRTGLDPGEAAQFGSASQVPGARSDVTMIMHLDPTNDSVSLLSIPRDLFVPLPPHSIAGPVGKIDAALNDGPNNLISAITSNLGIPINHYMEINFDGFQRTIDAIGGIKMSFPTQLRDLMSALLIPRTGCLQLNGATALAVVRARHLQYYANGRWQNDPQSDLARIRRDHTFLRIFVNTAKGQVTNPLRLNALVGGLLNQVTVDSGLNVNTMLALFRHFRHLNPDTAPQTTLPITVVPNYHYGPGAYGDVDMPVEPLDHQVIDTWLGKPAPAASPSSVAVKLVNISGTSRKATTIAAGITAAGFQVVSTSTGSNPASITETLIHYHPGSVDQAIGVLHVLTGAVMLEADPAIADGNVTVDVGSVVAVAAPAAATAAQPAATATPTTAAAGAPSIPTALGETPSSAEDQPAAFDPVACP